MARRLDAEEATMKSAFLLGCTICGFTFAQPTAETAKDLAYCHKLSTIYRTYVENAADRRPVPSADAEIAIDRCNTGDASGIRTLEHALEQARIGLPPRN
jgi:hypothetical protein